MRRRSKKNANWVWGEDFKSMRRRFQEFQKLSCHFYILRSNLNDCQSWKQKSMQIEIRVRKQIHSCQRLNRTNFWSFNSDFIDFFEFHSWETKKSIQIEIRVRKQIQSCQRLIWTNFLPFISPLN